MKLEPFLQQQGVPFEKHAHSVVYTSQQLAQAEHVPGYVVAKPVIVKRATGFAMCVLAAPQHLDLRRAAEALHEPEVRLATEAEMAPLFPDSELGAEPPVGTLFGLPTIMDQTLKDNEYLVMQSGAHTQAIRMRREDWERVCQPQVAALATS
ncbi:MAG: YbaK/EbsC family protein [Planctomycetota bacterium]